MPSSANLMFPIECDGLSDGMQSAFAGSDRQARLAQGRAAGSAVDAMSRQPGAIARIQVAMLLGLAFIESLVLFVFVIAILLLFVKS